VVFERAGVAESGLGASELTEVGACRAVMFEGAGTVEDSLGASDLAKADASVFAD
jgi:hypothetical protein